MKANHLFYLAASLLLLSCGGEDKKEPDNPPVPIQFTGNVQFHTKATDAGFEMNDQIGVYISKWNGNSQNGLYSSGNHADNHLYTYASGGFTSNPILYYPNDGNAIDVYAYYPRVVTSSATTIPFTVKSDQTSAKSYTDSDFMTAHIFGRTVSTLPIPLTFTHALSRIVIELDETSMPAGTASVRLDNVYTSCRYDLSTDESTTTGSKGQITLQPNGKNRFVGILPPQSIQAGEQLAIVTIGGKEYSWKPKQQAVFLANTEHEYILVMENNDPIAFTGTINPWGKPRINEVVPTDIQARIREHMPIYNGENPPDVMGTYLVNPVEMIHSSISGDMEVGYEFADQLFRFTNQSFAYNTLDYESIQGTGDQSGEGYFISGSGNNFTVFFNTTGTSNGIATKQATVISGTKTSSGISYYRMAFVMLEKGADPTGQLVPVGTLRIFKDGNELASNSSWLKSEEIDDSGYLMIEMFRETPPEEAEPEPEPEESVPNDAIPLPLDIEE